MSTIVQRRQAFIRHFADQKGEEGFTMLEVAKAAEKMGWPLPKPSSPLEMLANQFKDAAREETRRDKKTGRPYRVWHAYPAASGEQGTLWADIEDIKRPNMVKSAQNRREQVVGDIVQLTFDIEHWSNAHPSDEPITVETDFTLDVEWRKNSEGNPSSED